MKVQNFADRNIRHQRKLKRYEPNFDTTVYAEKFQQTFIEAHEALCKFVKDKIKIFNFIFLLQILLGAIPKN